MEQNLFEKATALLDDPLYVPTRSDLEKLLSWHTEQTSKEVVRLERINKQLEDEIDALEDEIDMLKAERSDLVSDNSDLAEDIEWYETHFFEVEVIREILAVDSLTDEIFMRGVCWSKDYPDLKLLREVKQRL